MASTYTTNVGIEKIGIGEQNNTWGTTLNTNQDIIDRSIGGQVRVTLPGTGSSGTPNDIAITDGALSDGQHAWIEVYSASDLGGTAFVRLTPNDAERLIYFKNSLAGGRSVNIFQGTYNASNDYTLSNGGTALLRFDGGGSGAIVVNTLEGAVFGTLSSPTISTPAITGGTITSTAINTSTITGGTVNDITLLDLVDGSTIAGNAVVSGTWTFDGHVTLSDNIAVRFGTGADTTILHNGTNTIITDASSGMVVKTASFKVQNAAGTEDLIEAVQDSFVKLRHNNTARLTTTVTGVDVTGDLEADSFSGAGVSTNITTDTGSTTKVPHVAAVETYVSGFGGFTFLAKRTLSASTSAVFTEFNASLYDSYLFVLQNVVPGTDNVSLNFQLSNNGGSSYIAGTSYQWGGTNNASTASQGGSGRSEFQMNVGSQLGNDAGIGISGKLLLSNPGDSSTFTLASWQMAQGGTSGQITNGIASGMCPHGGSAEAHNACRFIPSSGNLATGSILMFGMKNA